MGMKLEVITPERAKQLLEAKRPTNRPISPNQVNMLVRAITEGLWEVNFDTIKLTSKGELIDGQHRMMACVTAGKSIQTWVAYDVSVKSMATMDTHKPRSASDNIAIIGYQNASLITATIRKLVFFATNSKSIKLSPRETETLLRLHSIQESCRQAMHGGKGLFPGSSLAAIHYIGAMVQSRQDEKLVLAADKFLKTVKSGIPNYEGDPAYVVREFVIAKNASRVSTIDPQTKDRMLAAAWEAHRAGKTWRAGVRGIPDKPEIQGWNSEVCFGKKLLKSFDAERARTSAGLKEMFGKKAAILLKTPRQEDAAAPPPLRIVAE